MNKDIKINNTQLNNFLSSGYKSLYKTNQTYFKDVFFLKNSENLSKIRKIRQKIEKFDKNQKNVSKIEKFDKNKKMS